MPFLSYTLKSSASFAKGYLDPSTQLLLCSSVTTVQDRLERLHLLLNLLYLSLQVNPVRLDYDIGKMTSWNTTFGLCRNGSFSNTGYCNAHDRHCVHIYVCTVRVCVCACPCVVMYAMLSLCDNTYSRYRKHVGNNQSCPKSRDPCNVSQNADSGATSGHCATRG